MPNVLLVAQPTTEGVAICVADLARAALPAGWDVTVACPPDGLLAGWVQDAGATWLPLDLRREPSPGDAAAVRRLRALAPQFDVVHLHSSKAGAVGRLALASMRKATRPRSLFTPHAWSWMVGGRLAPAYRAIERMLAGQTDAIVAVSDEERTAGVSVLGNRAAGRIRVIPNGVDLGRFSPAGRRAERPESPLLVCVGRLARQKGQDIAIRSLARMQAPDATLRLVGTGPDEAMLRELAAELGVADRVDFAGFSADPAGHLRAADIVVVPSRWDGLSLGLLEAMACGRPVVATRVTGAAAVEGAGVLVDPDDPAGLAEALDDLLADPARRDDLGHRARMRAEDRFSGQQRVAEVLDLWSSLLR